jgi:hypothetical protein
VVLPSVWHHGQRGQRAGLSMVSPILRVKYGVPRSLEVNPQHLRGGQGGLDLHQTVRLVIAEPIAATLRVSIPRDIVQVGEIVSCQPGSDDIGNLRRRFRLRLNATMCGTWQRHAWCTQRIIARNELRGRPLLRNMVQLE